MGYNQWRNRRGKGGRVPSRDFWPRNFCWRIGKKEARKKGKGGGNWEERRKIVKGKVENWKWKLKSYKKMWGFFFFFFFFCFSLLKTTEICFRSTKMEIFFREKAFHAGKKNQEKLLCPLRKICLLRSWLQRPHIWAWDRGSPRKWRNRAKSELYEYYDIT